MWTGVSLFLSIKNCISFSFYFLKTCMEVVKTVNCFKSVLNPGSGSTVCSLLIWSASKQTAWETQNTKQTQVNFPAYVFVL